MTKVTKKGTLAMMVVAGLAPASPAQSLFTRDPLPAVDEQGRADTRANLRNASFLFVQPPEPRTFKKHDLVYVILDEITSAESSQTLETTKEFEIDGNIDALLDFQDLLETQIRGGNLEDVALIEAAAEREFTGEGEYDRTDRITTRLAAEVVDVKPNGTLVLEARKTLKTDNEERTFVLSGIAFQDDITNARSILSSQLADLRVDLQHKGDVRNAAKKGVLTRLAELIFNF